MPVKLIYLPPMPDGAKCGLDDYLADGHSVADLLSHARDRATRPASPIGDRPEIKLVAGELPESVTAGEDALLKLQPQQVYQHGETLVRVVAIREIEEADGIKRRPGSYVLVVLDENYLRELFTIAALWLRFDSRLDDWKRLDCPKDVARTYQSRIGHWRVPILTGLIGAPTLRADGSPLEQPGYDAATGRYATFSPGQFRPLSVRPTRDDAAVALRTLIEPLSEFPWVMASDRAAALAAIITVLVRHLVPTAPMTAFLAPRRGSGKSLLADIVSIIGTGHCVAVMTPGINDEEMRKRVFASLLKGDPVPCIDNITGEISSPALGQVLSQTRFQDRLLGASKMVTLPTGAATWLATGNNVTFAGDLPRRVVPCNIDARIENPSTRTFKREESLVDYVRKHRPDLVYAGLTIVQAYLLAGRPKQGLEPFGSFEGWSNLIRSALVWAGEADPCEGRAELEEYDPDQQQLGAVHAAWRAEFGTRNVTGKDLIDRAIAQTNGDLFRALMDVAMGRDGKLDGRKLGKWLLAHVKVVASGWRIERTSECRDGWRWTLVESAGFAGSAGLPQPTRGNCQDSDIHIEGAENNPPNSPNPQATAWEDVG